MILLRDAGCKQMGANKTSMSTAGRLMAERQVEVNFEGALESLSGGWLAIVVNKMLQGAGVNCKKGTGA